MCVRLNLSRPWASYVLTNIVQEFVLLILQGLNGNQYGRQSTPLENKDNNNDSTSTKSPFNSCEESEENHLRFPLIKRFRATSAANKSA